MAKAKTSKKTEEVVESNVLEERNINGVTVFKKGQHPRDLRRAAENKAAEEAAEVEPEAESSEETAEAEE